MADETSKPASINIDTNVADEGFGAPVHIDTDPTYDPSQDQRPAFQKVKPLTTEDTIAEAPQPSVGQRIKKEITENIPQFSTRTVENPEYGKKSFLSSKDLLTAEEQQQQPVLTGALETVDDLASPSNVGLVAATGGLGELPEAAQPIAKVLSLAFSVQQFKAAYDQYPAFKAAVDRGDRSEALRLGFKLLSTAVFGAAAGEHALSDRPEGSAFAENPEAGALKVGKNGAPPEDEDELEPKISIDSNGTKWAEGANGVRVSIPKRIADADVAAYAAPKLAQQAAMQVNVKAKAVTGESFPHITFDEVGGTEVKAPELQTKTPATAAPPPQYHGALGRRGQMPGQTVDLSPAYGDTGRYVGGHTEAAPDTPEQAGREEAYHPDLQKIADKHGVSDSPKHGASFITPDGKFINLPADVHHPQAIEDATGVAGSDNRPDFMNNTGAVRMRVDTNKRAGPTLSVSVPASGVTPEQVSAIQRGVGLIGRTGNVMIERGDINSSTANSGSQYKEFASPRDVEPMLKSIGAHPDQATDKTSSALTPDVEQTRHDLTGDEEPPTTPEVAPNKKLQGSAQKYAKANGMDAIDHSPVEVDPEHAKQVAQQYHESEDAPNDPKVKASYDALKKETKDQFLHLTKDLGLKFEPQEEDPYTSAGEMMDDIRKNNRLKVFTGSSTGPEHPMSEIDPKTGQSYTTLFRWVHDAMGHAAGGHDFSENGEKSATEAHAQMYSDAARPAMRHETEGQTSWFFHNPDVESGAKQPGEFAPQKANILPDTSHNWHEKAGANAAKDEAGGINPRTGKSDTKGVGTEIAPEFRQPLDHAPTAEDFKNFYDQHRALFDKHPELRIGWDNKSAVAGGHEINIGAVGEDAKRVAKKLDQKSAFNIAKGEVIPTNGSGLRTDFSNYPMDERIKDLNGEPLSPSQTDFEHLSKDVYDNLEPDERNYLQGDKTLQRNVMSQYHKIQPSVPETTNAMQAGAALGGWWKRYIDIFHGLMGEDKLKSQPKGLELYHGTRGNFEQFDPMRGGHEGDFGTHFGTLDQAHSRLRYEDETGVPPEGQNIRPSYVDIKNPLRLEDQENFEPNTIVSQLIDKGILTDKQADTLTHEAGHATDPIKLREFLESKGYDGLVYMNRYEGTSPEAVETMGNGSHDYSDAEFADQYPEAKGNDSYIAFRPEQIQPKYSADHIAQTMGPSHAEVLKQWHAALSANKNVGDANNLAWHSYADWLDAGKPTDRKSIDAIVRKNGAQPAGSGKKGNAAVSDTLGPRGEILSRGVDTNKLFSLINSPEMRGDRPFSGDVFNDDAKNPLMGTKEGARKVPSMGATVAGKGNLNRLVIDAHIRDFYGHSASGGPAAQYIADSAHLRQAAKALGLKGGEGQEQLWGTVLGLKTLLKEGLTPAEASGKLSAKVINDIGKDYAEVIKNDPEITRPGGILDRLAEKHGAGRGAAGLSEAYSKTSGSSAGEGQPAGGSTPIDTALLGKTAGRIRESISDSKIKKPSAAATPESTATPEDEDTSFSFGANAKPEANTFKRPAPKPKATTGISAVDLIRALKGMKSPGKK